MSTLTKGTTVHTPDLLLLYQTEQRGRNINDILLDGTVSVQIRPAGPRSGRLQALFIAGEAAATALAADIASGALIALADEDRSSIEMNFILPGDGTVRVELDDNTREDFIVTWDFQEVP